MQSNRFHFICGIAVGLLFFVTACSSAPGSASTSATATSTPQPTATAVTIPAATAAFCEGLISFTEANTIISPINPIVGVATVNSAHASSCQFTDAAKNVPLLLNFAYFSSGTSINTAAANYIAQVFNYPHTAVATSHAVSGVGNQAWYISSTITGGNISAHAKVLCAAVGSFLLCITNISMNGTALLSSVSDSVVQGEFVQVANLVISRM